MPTLICASDLDYDGLLRRMAHGDEAHGWVGLDVRSVDRRCHSRCWPFSMALGRSRLCQAKRSRPNACRPHLLFCGGMLTLAGALLSPLHWLGEHLFTFHMIEHEIVMAVSAPLIVLARPGWHSPVGIAQSRRAAGGGRCMRHPLMRAAMGLVHGRQPAPPSLHGVAIWGWHMPLLFDAAVTKRADASPPASQLLRHGDRVLVGGRLEKRLWRRSLAPVPDNDPHQHSRRLDGACSPRALRRADAKPRWPGG